MRKRARRPRYDAHPTNLRRGSACFVRFVFRLTSYPEQHLPRRRMLPDHSILQNPQPFARVPDLPNNTSVKIYTKTGDDGTTGLIGGDRVRKCDPRIDCYGTVDELNATLGIAIVSLTHPASRALHARLVTVQNELFVLGSHLAVPDATPVPAYLPPLEESMVGRLEMEIDEAEQALPPLKTFILPGGTEPAARLHLARTVCRRAERLLVDFSHDRHVPPVVLTYLNRLSDWLFVMARLANHHAGVADEPWVK